MIEARGLVKHYRSTLAVNNLSFDVRPGTVTGFLGPNGAGKSTTMRMIMGLDRPDAGQVRIGRNSYADLRWPLREVGALLEAKAFHPGRTARSTWYIMIAFAVSMIGLAMLVLSHENYPQLSAADRAAFDPTHDTFIALVLAQLPTGVLGVLAITAEFTSGMIRATFAAVPRRPLVLAAKAAVLGAATLMAGEITAFAGFAAGQAVLQPPAPHATLGQPGVLRAVLMAGAYPALSALIALGLGALIRHTAGAICAVVGLLFVLPLLAAPLGPSILNTVQNFLPHVMANSISAARPVAHMWPPWLSFALLCGYAVAALAAGSWALTSRDA